MNRRLLALVLVVFGCSSEGYDNNDAELAVRQKAKETCSCLFVMKMSESYCAEWTRVTPNVAKAEIQYGKKRVKAHALLFYEASARFTEGQGCALED